MKTGNKIALFYTTVTVGIVVAVALIFYFFAARSVSRLYYSYLTEKAYVIAQKYWEKDELDEEDYALVQQQYEETLPVASEILLNADSVVKTRAVLQRYLTEIEIDGLYKGSVVHFHKDEKWGAAVYYPDNEGNFIVLVMSGNQYGGDILERIGWLLVCMLLLSAVLIYFVGRLYAIRMVDRIDAAYQSEKSFISNASHELNNPLTAIQGECEITLLKERTPAEYEASLERIAQETKRIIQLMRNLLFLSHGDKEVLKNARENICMADFLKQFEDSRVCLKMEDRELVVFANPVLLRSAIGNILHNACKYSGEKLVEVSLKQNELVISDQGIGIPEAELKLVYQPFFRASNTCEYNGHGIGLSLSLRILQVYGAQVTLRSEEGKGTVVRIVFKEKE